MVFPQGILNLSSRGLTALGSLGHRHTEPVSGSGRAEKPLLWASGAQLVTSLTSSQREPRDQRTPWGRKGCFLSQYQPKGRGEGSKGSQGAETSTSGGKQEVGHPGLSSKAPHGMDMELGSSLVISQSPQAWGMSEVSGAGSGAGDREQVWEVTLTPPFFGGFFKLPLLSGSRAVTSGCAQ